MSGDVPVSPTATASQQRAAVGQDDTRDRPGVAWSRFQDRPGWQRMLVYVVAAVLLVNLSVLGTSSILGGSQPGGESGSSFATAPSGLAAWASLLAHNGVAVTQLRDPLAQAPLDPRGVLVIADPSALDVSDGRAITAHLAAGGRVVVLGDASGAVLSGFGVSYNWDRARTRTVPVVGDTPEASGASELTFDGPDAKAPGRWVARFVDLHGATPLAADRSGVVAAAFDGPGGHGRVVAVTSSVPFDNAHLGDGDNAAFSLAVVGPNPASVVFAESFHGYGPSKGWSALPIRWRTALLVALIAVLVAMWAVARRFGPIEEESAPLTPPRRTYVDALAAGLSRGDDPAAVVVPLQTALRRRIRARTGSAPTAGDVDLVRAATQAGWPEPVVARALASPANASELLGTCQAAAHLLAFDASPIPSRGGPQ